MKRSSDCGARFCENTESSLGAYLDEFGEAEFREEQEFGVVGQKSYYERTGGHLLFCELARGRESGETGGWVDAPVVRDHFINRASI